MVGVCLVDPVFACVQLAVHMCRVDVLWFVNLELEPQETVNFLPRRPELFVRIVAQGKIRAEMSCIRPKS